jgi:hypothetical protein
VGSTGHAALGVTYSSNCMTCHTGSYLGTSRFRAHPGSHKATTANANNCTTSGCHRQSFTSSPSG